MSNFVKKCAPVRIVIYVVDDVLDCSRYSSDNLLIVVDECVASFRTSASR